MFMSLLPNSEDQLCSSVLYRPGFISKSAFIHKSKQMFFRLQIFTIHSLVLYVSTPVPIIWMFRLMLDIRHCCKARGTNALRTTVRNSECEHQTLLHSIPLTCILSGTDVHLILTHDMSAMGSDIGFISVSLRAGSVFVLEPVGSLAGCQRTCRRCWWQNKNNQKTIVLLL